MVDMVVASTYCLVSGESMWPARIVHVTHGRNSSADVTTWSKIITQPAIYTHCEHPYTII